MLKWIRENKALVVIIGLVFLQSLIYFISVISDLKVKNEYYYLDELTKLADGKVVSNKAYDLENLVLNEAPGEKFQATSKNIFDGNNGRFDINRIPEFKYYQESIFGDIGTMGSKYNYLVRNKESYFVVDVYNSKSIAFLNSSIFKYYYSDCLNYNEMLAAYERYHEKVNYYSNIKDLDDDLPTCMGHFRTKQIMPLIVANDEGKLAEKLDYVNKNLDESLLQAYSRYYFHESSFVLAPINEMRLGKPLGEIFSQYGFLSILGVSAVMDLLGGFSFPNYEKAMKLSYLIYYLICIYVSFKMFRDNRLRLGFALVLAIGLLGNSYYFFQYPPGHTPLRHFFDIFVLYYLWCAAKKSSFWHIFIAAIFVILSIFTNKEYGMMLAAAFICAMIYDFTYQSIENLKINYKALTILVLSSVAFICALKYYPLADNPSSPYFLDGFYSFRVSDAAFGFVLLSIFVQLSVVVFWGRQLQVAKLLMPYIFIALYSHLLYFYFVWGGGNAHFFVLLQIYLLPFFILLSEVHFGLSSLRVFFANGMLAVLAIATVFFGKQFLKDWRYASSSFDNHVSYQWTLPRASGMWTKIDPDLFVNSVELVKKYQKENKIFSISKYDNLLSILSETYSGTEFFELRSMLVTKQDYDIVKAQLESSDILFVDNDIDRDFESEESQAMLWNMLPALNYEHKYQRIPKLMLLRQLYREVVVNKYRKVDEGKLISVYQKN